jgi:hypothetical protein
MRPCTLRIASAADGIKATIRAFPDGADGGARAHDLLRGKSHRPCVGECASPHRMATRALATPYAASRTGKEMGKPPGGNSRELRAPVGSRLRVVLTLPRRVLRELLRRLLGAALTPVAQLLLQGSEHGRLPPPPCSRVRPRTASAPPLNPPTRNYRATAARPFRAMERISIHDARHRSTLGAEGTGHWPQVERPLDVAEAVVGWASDIVDRE